jgi:hypothetical protein
MASNRPADRPFFARHSGQPRYRAAGAAWSAVLIRSEADRLRAKNDREDFFIVDGMIL